MTHTSLPTVLQLFSRQQSLRDCEVRRNSGHSDSVMYLDVMFCCTFKQSAVQVVILKGLWGGGELSLCWFCNCDLHT